MSNSTHLLNHAKSEERIKLLETLLTHDNPLSYVRGQQEALQSLSDALREGLRLYEPGSAGLWSEQARAALKKAEPFLEK